MAYEPSSHCWIVFDFRLDDPLLLRIPRGTWVDPEAISLGALGVRALHDRVADAGP